MTTAHLITFSLIPVLLNSGGRGVDLETGISVSGHVRRKR